VTAGMAIAHLKDRRTPIVLTVDGLDRTIKLDKLRAIIFSDRHHYDSIEDISALPDAAALKKQGIRTVRLLLEGVDAGKTMQLEELIEVLRFYNREFIEEVDRRLQRNVDPNEDRKLLAIREALLDP